MCESTYSTNTGNPVSRSSDQVALESTCERSQHQQPQRQINHDQVSKPKLGTYEIDKKIGQGIFSIVSLGTHTITGLRVAIKMIDKTRLDPENLARINRESNILKKLHHTHIVKLFQVMETSRFLYLVTEFLPNGEVFDHITTHGRFTETRARSYFIDVLSAIEYTHSCGIVHRDLKAENLLFDSDMNIKLIDFSFGTSHLNNGKQALLTTWCGSPPYAAPEIFNGEPYLGTKSDIWSLGVVLYVMVCGALPFDAQHLPLLKMQVLSASFRVPYWLSISCERLLRLLMAKLPSKRPSTKEIFQHPWITQTLPDHGPPPSSSSNNVDVLPAQVSPSPPDQPPTVQLHSVPHSSRSLSFSGECHHMTHRSAPLTEPGPNLAADLELGKVNELVMLIMESYGMKRSQILESLHRKAYDHLMATYLLLGEKVRRHRPSLTSTGSQAEPIGTPSQTECENLCQDSRPVYQKESYIDSAVDMKCSVSGIEFDETSTPSVNVVVHPHGYDQPYTQSDRISSDFESLIPNNSTAHHQPTIFAGLLVGDEIHNATSSIDPVSTTAQQPNMIDTMTTCNSHECSNEQLATLEEDRSPVPLPWFTCGINSKIDNMDNPIDEFPRRNLIRRKYGVFTPPDCLDQLAREVLAENNVMEFDDQGSDTE